MFSTMNNNLPPPIHKTDYSKIARQTKEKMPNYIKKPKMTKWENVFVENEKEFIHMDSVLPPINMSKYVPDNEKPIPMQFIQDPHTQTYIVAKDNGIMDVLDKELEDSIREEVKTSVVNNELSHSWKLNDTETPETNYWLHFYVSSLSVVGLFILFRLIQKSS